MPGVSRSEQIYFGSTRQPVFGEEVSVSFEHLYYKIKNKGKDTVGLPTSKIISKQEFQLLPRARYALKLSNFINMRSLKIIKFSKLCHICYK